MKNLSSGLRSHTNVSSGLTERRMTLSDFLHPNVIKLQRRKVTLFFQEGNRLCYANPSSRYVCA
jgi:hypothetical protein